MSQESAGQGLTGALPWTAVRRQDPCIVALGNFDGVHLGHRRILESLLRESAASGLAPVLVTFEPHPRYFFKPLEKPSLLSTPGEKRALLGEWPVEVIPLAFDMGLAGLDAEAFIEAFLKDRLQGRRFLLGHDHRFGKGARGDASLLQRHVRDPQADVLILEPYQWQGEVVSSSAIRAHLEAARIERANTLLGRPFSYAGKVARGDGRGRGLGFPTANLDLGYPFKAIAALGVYGGMAVVDGREVPAIANIGMRPTFGGEAVKIEVHLLDFDQDLYDKGLEFRLLFHVRPECKFPSVEALRRQVEKDIAETRLRMAH
ncbi:MAG TPA: riboflavin biosynthesis protein RibF [Fibrobacteria bacterium]|nr:riboflavin biosynthesis protein RibF [Fibrobacteria bacterium]